MDENDTSSSGRSSHCNSSESGRPPPLRTNSIRSFTEAEKNKIRAIRAACEAGDRGSLIQHAISADGLVSDDVRRDACTPPRAITPCWGYIWVCTVLIGRFRVGGRALIASNQGLAGFRRRRTQWYSGGFTRTNAVGRASTPRGRGTGATRCRSIVHILPHQ